MEKKPHYPYVKPENKDEHVWRYQSFAKFVSMLEHRALYFSRATDLEKEDPFEGGLVFPGLDRIVDLAGSLDVEIIDPEGNSQAVRITITDSALVVDESLGVMDGNFELTIEGCQGQWQVFSKRLPDEDE